ncbi:hypothetical protein LJK88_32900 [Paenibacillus sp. P26]|nr:hypothetical protein LJK88_32900 [Paenibacillus sp. P26]UUZ97880.1 hypothetical protein LJK87_05170 [Paenibacillus sp. P25]
MNISYEQTWQVTRSAAFALEPGESVHVLHPNQIIAFQGAPSMREDSFMKLSGMYRKKDCCSRAFPVPPGSSLDSRRVIPWGRSR